MASGFRSAGTTTSIASRSISSTSIRISIRRGRGSAWSTATPTTAARKALRVDRPFYALDTRHALRHVPVRFDPRATRATRTARKSASSSTTNSSRKCMAAGRRACSNGWVRRWTAGVTYHRSRFAVVLDEPLGGPLPEDRELVYPWVGFDLVQDEYQERTNQDQIERTEDVLLGLRAGGAHRLCRGGARVGSRCADAQRVRAERLGLRARQLAVRDGHRLGPRRERRLAQCRADGRGAVLPDDLRAHEVLRDHQRHDQRESRRRASRSCSAARKACAAIRCATRPARRGRCSRSRSATTPAGIRSACSTSRPRRSSTWGAPGAPT